MIQLRSTQWMATLLCASAAVGVIATAAGGCDSAVDPPVVIVGSGGASASVGATGTQAASVQGPTTGATTSGVTNATTSPAATTATTDAAATSAGPATTSSGMAQNDEPIDRDPI